MYVAHGRSRDRVDIVYYQFVVYKASGHQGLEPEHCYTALEMAGIAKLADAACLKADANIS